ncbi:glycosyltransferase family 4 protein [Paraburkholderia caballeronis]|uniref:Glycosyl transferases group 1 n=2 Tax=Paraburkholderia caballeronis TaxID=416943 RepID=A0A1H7JZ26_9BURK|nr:glycosyltransferase family 1 protein [Paraburkholderia caballeronis]PXW27234.1 glycosyl transferase family 1 [Paraburkholderia caballeronis]PXX02708.1 glycosyl transferase family 1 [Paraburkholderia caballeronis]RAK03433.1 glycosyl transferase family 1 [Paraburkholderia caballeronis]TDV17096.1 glycosyl transferase family 1 [Paraburkholderia caballeronis]TDV17481.1 glycosyl transferase family 1 [Paraburkholderia caballeronis]
MVSTSTRRLAINGRFLGRQLTGVDRFAFETVRAIDELLATQDPIVVGLQAELLVPGSLRAMKSPFARIPLREARGGAGTRWEQVSLPFAATGSLLLNLCNSGPMFCRRQVTVLHDAAPMRMPQSYSRAFAAWYRVMAPRVGRVAQRILTVSEFSRRELTDVYRIPAAKIGIVSESGEHMLRVPAADASPRWGELRRPYVLAVGSLNYHKNFRLVVEAAKLLGDAPFDIVVVGGADPRVYGNGHDALQGFVRHLGYVTDAELTALYRDAACFVYPSRYEGFGLPPVEALALGCPVIASRLPSIEEACGDAVLYVSPDDPHELARLLADVTTDAALRSRLREKGHARAAQLTWRATAVKLLEEISPWLT